MQLRFSSLILAAFAALAFHAAPVLAEPAGCAAPSVLSFIDSQFQNRAENYLHSNLVIVDFDRVRDGGFAARDETHSVERQYCHARATMNDGRKRTVWYLIERNWGFAGLGQSVEFCVSGLDPWHVYGRQCSSLR
jgi:hypothetical protein